MSQSLILSDRGPTPQRDGVGLLRRLGRLAAMSVGGVLVLAGILIAPLPGPLGLPLSVLGLALILRNSWWAKRRFIRAQRAWPNFIFPFRRLLRPKPEVAPVFWQQALRAERLLLRRRRVLIRLRKRRRARTTRTAAAA
jgi:hypothetical protein